MPLNSNINNLTRNTILGVSTPIFSNTQWQLILSQWNTIATTWN
jgi:hypothetical protein